MHTSSTHIVGVGDLLISNVLSDFGDMMFDEGKIYVFIYLFWETIHVHTSNKS